MTATTAPDDVSLIPMAKAGQPEVAPTVSAPRRRPRRLAKIPLALIPLTVVLSVVGVL